MNRSRILVVDDQPNWREVITDVLRDAGDYVRGADSVASAWKLLDKEDFDIAILDVRLVDSNPYDIQGIELLEQMKEKLGDRFPIVVMTGYSFEGMEEILRTDYGVRDFINKGSAALQNLDAFRNRIYEIVLESV
ncbi:response regulator [Chloroflexota bacterium]